MSPKDNSYFQDLKKKAEMLAHHPASPHPELVEIGEILHELTVYQIELEMQNEQLKAVQTELLAAQKRLTQLFDLAPVGYVVLNDKAQIIQSNQTIHAWLGMNVQHKFLAELIYREDLPIFNGRYPAFFKRPEQKHIELRLQKTNQQLLSVELTGRLIKSSHDPLASGCDNGKECLLLNIIDISARNRLEEELRLAAKVFENSDESIMITDHKTQIVNVNPAFTAVTGYDAQEVVGKTPKILKSGKQTIDFYRQMWNRLNREGHWQGEIWNRRKNGDFYLEWLSINTVTDKFGRPNYYIAIFSDITQRKQNEQQIEQLAHYDALTALPNRLLFNERLKHGIVRATRHKQWIAVLFLDLDRFKTLNDTLGHFMGDMLLQAVGQRLMKCVRKSDTVARFGGDEFVIVLTDFNDEQTATLHTAEIANKILSELNKPFDLSGNKFMTSTSIGFAFFPRDGHSVAELVKNADTAMYQAKAQGRNNYQSYSDEMREQALSRSTLENDLRSALSNRELVLFYQPIVDLHNLNTIGFETLIRWRHPKRGLILPDQFIPIAEETGLIVGIGDWVLQDACRQLKNWHQSGKTELKIAVNLSARQFLQHDLFSTVRNVLDTHDLQPHHLELEITETMIMRNLGETTRILKQLQQLGINISLDDFGTGYSSLTYLKQFPINTLKIDRSFVRDILNSHDDRVIVNSIIAIAQHMRLNIVTEGIEHLEQADYLREIGCQFGQGYWFSMPCAAEECFIR